MKKISYIITVILSAFIFSNTTNALISGSTSSLQATGGVSGCKDYLCYSTRVNGTDDWAHIGIRFSLVYTNGEPTEYNVDLLTGELINQLNALSSQVVTFETKSSKKSISSWGNWNDGSHNVTGWDNPANTNIGGNIVSKNASTIASEASSLSWYLGNLNGVVVSASSHSGSQIYDHFFGGGGQGYLVDNYNSGTDGGHSVFYTAGGTDKNALNDILGSMIPGLTGDQLSSKNYMIQIEPITIINAKVNSNRYYIYGTTSEIRAILSQLSLHDFGVSKGYNIAVLFNDHPYGYKEKGVGVGNSALSYLNTGMYASIKLGDTYGGEDGVCTGGGYGWQYNWNLSNYHNCGIGIITGLGNAKVCQAVENDDEHPEVSVAYYGNKGQYLNDSYTKYEEEFINECLCHTDTKSFRTGGEDFVNTHSAFASNNSAYIETWCKSNPVKKTKICQPIVEKNECSESITIRDDEACVFGTDSNNNINTSVSSNADSYGSNQHLYTTEANEYCNISCAEKITFTMPGRVDGITSGTYFTFPAAISATGTRTCRANLAMYTFNSRVARYTNTDSSNVTNAVVKKDGSNYVYKDDSSYSFREQNLALKTSYSNIADSYTAEYMYNNNCDYYCDSDEGPCYNHDKQYSYSVDINGKTFSHTNSCGGGRTFSSSVLTEGTTSLANYKAAINDGIVKTASSISTEIKKINNCTASFTTDKDSTYDFAPDIEFYYDEPYTTFFNQKYNRTFATGSREGYVDGRIFSHTDFNYSSSGSVTNDQKADYSYINNNSDTAYIAYTATKEVTSYNSPVTFFTSIPKGIATVSKPSGYTDYAGNTYKTVKQLAADVYPIALTTTPNTYNYSFRISGLGDKSISSTVQKPGDIPNSNHVGRMDKLLSNDARTYYCKYSTVQDICVNDSDPNCKNEFFYRNISLNNFNPNNRELGANWDTTKGRTTQCEIDKDTEFKDGTKCNSYPKADRNRQNETVYDKDPEYSFTLTPDNMKAIRDYNRSEGKTYGDDSLELVGSTVRNKSAEMENVWYKSTFLDDIDKYTKEHSIDNGRSSFAAWTGDDIAKVSNRKSDQKYGTGPAWK